MKSLTPATFCRPLVRAINETRPGLIHLINACNIALDGKAEWVKIRYGVYPNKVGLQVFDQESAQAIHAAFNEKTNRLAQLFRGEPIYVGHPDDPEWAKRHPEIPMEAKGRIREMKVGADGLALRVAYNDGGLKLVGGDAPAYEAFSPHWGMVETTHQGRTALRPVELYSIGLTNHPNIPGTFIGLNEALPEETNPAMKQHIIALLAALGRPVANAAAVTDEQLATAVNEVVPVATKLVADAGQLATATNEVSTVKGQLTAAQAQVQTAVNESAGLRTQLAAERTARAGILITTAINEGRLTEAGRTEWLGKFTAQGATFETVEGELKKLVKAVNTRAQADVGGRRGAPDAKAKSKITAINEAVSAYKKETGETDHNVAFNAVRQRKPELFEKDAN